jgi:hypothetical protein
LIDEKGWRILMEKLRFLVEREIVLITRRKLGGGEKI